MTVKTINENALYEITTPSGRKVRPAEGRAWVYSKQKFNELCADNRITFEKDGNNKPCIKRFLSEVEDSKIVPKSVWLYEEVGENRNGRQEVKNLFDDKGYFDTPKPVSLLSRILQVAGTNSDDMVIDFFSGSATTAHAVMQLNAEDSGNRKFIMVQLPEPCDEKSEAYKAGFVTIADIGKERIRRAGQKIKTDKTPDLDIGFRVLKIDSSNMNEVYYSPDQTSQKNLSNFVNNIRPDRSDEDLLFQVLLDWGVDLTLPIVEKTIDEKTVFTVADNEIVACFDRQGGITEDFIKQLTTSKPKRVVFCDSGFADDSVKINVEQVFKSLSAHTDIKTI